jgi:hypothetical protein
VLGHQAAVGASGHAVAWRFGGDNVVKDEMSGRDALPLGKVRNFVENAGPSYLIRLAPRSVVRISYDVLGSPSRTDDQRPRPRGRPARGGRTAERFRRWSRWRPATGTDLADIQRDEVRLTGRRVLLGDGDVISAVSETLWYRPRKEGYHGGAALAEMVIPWIVLARRGIHAQGHVPIGGQAPRGGGLQSRWRIRRGGSWEKTSKLL